MGSSLELLRIAKRSKMSSLVISDSPHAGSPRVNTEPYLSRACRQTTGYLGQHLYSSLDGRRS